MRKIKINMDKATCCKCGKSVDWTKINLPYIGGRAYPLCDECKQAVLDFINNEETEEENGDENNS